MVSLVSAVYYYSDRQKVHGRNCIIYACFKYTLHAMGSQNVAASNNYAYVDINTLSHTHTESMSNAVAEDSSQAWINTIESNRLAVLCDGQKPSSARSLRELSNTH